MTFSVLFSVYQYEKHEYLDQALQSIEKQTLIPNEIVLVKDGPLTPDLEEVIARHGKNSAIPYNVVPLERNVGLGEALNIGLEHCSHAWIARMDTDDIALPDRFEKQFAHVEKNPDLDLLGGWIREFGVSPDEPGTIRKVPTEHEAIVRFAKFRNPMNHMTVVFRKRAVLEAGGYRHFPGFEDYALWMRMIHSGARLGNLSEILVLARTGQEMIKRRRGWDYLQKEWRFQCWLREMDFIGSGEFVRNILLRLPPRVLPESLTRKVYSMSRV